jgi:hypothetical protein
MSEETKIYDNEDFKERLEEHGVEPWDPGSIEKKEEELQREINKLLVCFIQGASGMESNLKKPGMKRYIPANNHLLR